MLLLLGLRIVTSMGVEATPEIHPKIAPVPLVVPTLGVCCAFRPWPRGFSAVRVVYRKDSASRDAKPPPMPVAGRAQTWRLPRKRT